MYALDIKVKEPDFEAMKRNEIKYHRFCSHLHLNTPHACTLFIHIHIHELIDTPYTHASHASIFCMHTNSSAVWQVSAATFYVHQLRH